MECVALDCAIYFSSEIILEPAYAVNSTSVPFVQITPLISLHAG